LRIISIEGLALVLRDASFRTKLMLAVCGMVLLTGAIVTLFAHRSARKSTEALANALFREVNGRAVTHTRAFVERAAPLVESLVQLTGNGLDLDDSDRLARQLLGVLTANPGLSWISYGDESGNFTGVYRPIEGGQRVNQSRINDGHTRLVEHDVLADGSWRLHRRDDNSGYDPRQRPFYEKAKATGRLSWLPPYVFYNQGVPGVSCAAPVYDHDHSLRGVLSIDFDLKSLSDFVADLSLSEHSEVFLFTADEVLLAHPSQRHFQSKPSAARGELMLLSDAGDPVIDALQRELRPRHLQAEKEDQFHWFAVHANGVEHLAATTAFRLGDDLVWIVGAAAPKSDFFSGVWQSQAMALAAASVALAVAVALAAFLARRVSGPVVSLIAFMQRVGAGDLNASADFGGGREFRNLSSALNRMIADLKDRLRLRHSLEIATEVQQRLLPRNPPRFDRFDVAGHSTYCDETGGDYYDFLVLDEPSKDSVLVALGDVMGHGVAAALVMAGARAVLRDRADAAGSLAEIMGRLNRLLAADLEGTRFMTMHLAVLNMREGVYRWVSAGHDPAIIYDPAIDAFDEINAAELPLGVMEETQYVENQCQLKVGQVILVGTDGLWESPDADGEHFGKERLRNAIREFASCTANEIVQGIVDRLANFRGSSRQVDDITFVVVKAVGQSAPVAPTNAAV
jgi:serine phosphatase RsbU (regulator of sigma subunit)